MKEKRENRGSSGQMKKHMQHADSEGEVSVVDCGSGGLRVTSEDVCQFNKNEGSACAQERTDSKYCGGRWAAQSGLRPGDNEVGPGLEAEGAGLVLVRIGGGGWGGGGSRGERWWVGFLSFPRRAFGLRFWMLGSSKPSSGT